MVMKRTPLYGDFHKGPLIEWQLYDNEVLVWTGMARSYPEALRKMKEEQSNGRKTGKTRKRKQQ